MNYAIIALERAERDLIKTLETLSKVTGWKGSEYSEAQDKVKQSLKEIQEAKYILNII